MVAVPASETIDQRFAQLVQQFGLTKNSFAISLGKTASVVQHLIDGRNKPGYDLLCKVFEIYPNVSRDWLLLGRGPMLVSGEHAPKPVAGTAQLPLEPIDLSDVEVPAPRRLGVGVAGSRLQPAEITATLVLAAAANQPARAAAPSPSFLPVEPTETPRSAAPLAAEIPIATQTPAVVAASVGQPQPVTPPFSDEVPAVPLAPSVATLPAAAPAPVVPASSNPENYVAAALHAQHLQHQLAVAEMRNQHLLEQQQMLREMLAMARQAMA